MINVTYVGPRIALVFRGQRFPRMQKVAVDVPLAKACRRHLDVFIVDEGALELAQSDEGDAYVPVRYVGSRARKTANEDGALYVWNGPGSVCRVPASVAPRLVAHSDVWQMPGGDKAIAQLQRLSLKDMTVAVMNLGLDLGELTELLDAEHASPRPRVRVISMLECRITELRQQSEQRQALQDDPDHIKTKTGPAPGPALDLEQDTDHDAA